MRTRLATQMTFVVLFTVGCAALPPQACNAPEGVRTYEAANIHEQWIDYVWVEVPAADARGTFPGRLFVASADPVGSIVPTMIDLPCEFSSGTKQLDLVPASVDIETDGAGSLKTSYAWGSCARCSECYMKWTFSLDLQGRVSEGALVADVVLNETFHSAPMKILSLRMPEVTQACTQPHIVCRAGGECSAIEFAPRQ